MAKLTIVGADVAAYMGVWRLLKTVFSTNIPLSRDAACQNGDLKPGLSNQ